MRCTASLAIACGTLLVLGMTAPAQAAPTGQTIGLTCLACHGDAGQGSGAIPPLVGRTADQLYRALLDFKTGQRPATVMDRHAKGYSDEELKAVADYFASLPAK
ncbi:MAG: c-type cytochrome [Pseudomonadota bacterium]